MCYHNVANVGDHLLKIQDFFIKSVSPQGLPIYEENMVSFVAAQPTPSMHRIVNIIIGGF